MVDLREHNHRDIEIVFEWLTQQPDNQEHPEWADPDWYLDDLELDWETAE